MRSGIDFIWIGISQAVIGRMILKSLRKEFVEFYLEHYKKLIVASSLLLLSNCITGVNLYNFYHPRYLFGKIPEKNRWLYLII